MNGPGTDLKYIDSSVACVLMICVCFE